MSRTHRSAFTALAALLLFVACAKETQTIRSGKGSSPSPGSESSSPSPASEPSVTEACPAENQNVGPYSCFVRTGRSVRAAVSVEESTIVKSEGQWTCFELTQPGTQLYSVEAEGGQLIFRGSTATSEHQAYVKIDVTTSAGTKSLTETFDFFSNRPMRLIRLYGSRNVVFFTDYQLAAGITGKNLTKCEIHVSAEIGTLDSS